MKRSLRRRLMVSHAGVVLLAVAIGAVGFNVAAGRRFDRYVADMRAEQMQAVARSVSDMYKPGTGWDASAVLAVGQAAKATGMQVAVYDTHQRIVFSAGDGQLGDAGQLGQLPPDPDIYLSANVPLAMNGTPIGTALVFVPKWPLPANIALRHSVDRYLVVAALIAALVAIVVGVISTQRLTRSLARLATAAVKVTGGRRVGRLDERGRDEIAALVRAFNVMAAATDREERSHETSVDLADEQLSLDEAGDDSPGR